MNDPGLHAGRVEHADHGIEIVEEEAEQQRQPRDISMSLT
jgi:hypothetical protein